MTKGVIGLPKALKEKLNEIKNEEFSDYLMPHIIFNSHREALIEGSKGILEYNSSRVRINCGVSVVRFSGADLCLRALSAEEVIITGEILKLEFC